jgi:hypothetical protein
VKPVILISIFATLLVGATGCTSGHALREEQTVKHDRRNDDLTAAAFIKPFPGAKSEKDAESMRVVTEADLLTLHVCQGSHKLFVNESASEPTEGLADAQASAECVVALRSALREVPATHPEYSEIRMELDWWSNKLLELDPADYRRLNS